MLAVIKITSFMSLNIGRDTDYDDINETSSNDDKIDIVLKKLSNNSPDYIDYSSLKIDYKNEKVFNAIIEKTGFVTPLQSQNSYNPAYKLSDKGLLLVHKHGSFKEFINAVKVRENEIQNSKEIQDKINAAKEVVEFQRQQIKDKTAQVDLSLKQWQVKTKYFPYVVSLLALITAIFSYFKPEKKPIDLQPMQQEIRALQEHERIQDSLFRLDTLLKKGS
jgi:cupin superfamily acireductone dioxygenase involved in methionine salvage